MSRASPLAVALSGYTVWALSFSILYAVQGYGCEAAWSDAGRRALLVGLWLASLAASALTLAATRATAWPDRAWTRIGWAANVSAAVATAWTGMPVLFATTCAG